MAFEFLEKQDIILINKETIAAHGGNFVPPFNILKEAPLDYVLEAVQAEMFGAPLYPELADKAAVYLFSIISGHIFSDGNKRTGLEAALVFLKMNGFRLRRDLEKETLLAFVIKVASGESNLEKCRAWFAAHIAAI